MYENSFATVNQKNKTENTFIPANAPVLYLKFEPPPFPNSHPLILPIKLYLAPKVTLLLYALLCWLPSAPSFTPYQNWQANKYSFLTVIELGQPVLESSTMISKLYALIDYKHKFHKAGIEN